MWMFGIVWGCEFGYLAAQPVLGDDGRVCVEERGGEGAVAGAAASAGVVI